MHSSDYDTHKIDKGAHQTPINFSKMNKIPEGELQVGGQL